MIEPDNHESIFEIPESIIRKSAEHKELVKSAGAIPNPPHEAGLRSLITLLQADFDENFSIENDVVLNVGVQADMFPYLDLNGSPIELIDPLNNLVAYLREQNIECYGVSPDIYDDEDINMVGLFNGTAQSIPAKENSFDTIISLAFLDESYIRQFKAANMDPNFYTDMASEYLRVMRDNGKLLLSGGPIAPEAISALTDVGFKIEWEGMQRRQMYMTIDK